MRYVIYGAGAIGAGVGARPHQHGFDVMSIARGAHLEAMRRDGLRLRAPGEDVRVPVKTVGHPSEIAWRGDEAVILTMKTQDTVGALEDLRAAAGLGVPVFCAQNGLENERLAARRFARTYTMLIHMPSTFVTPCGVANPQAGAISVVQRFSSALQLDVYFHVLFADGVWSDSGSGAVAFHPADVLNNASDPAHAQLLRAAIQGRQLTGAAAGSPLAAAWAACRRTAASESRLR